MVACWRNTQIFNLVDKDGGGTISKEELGELMETLGINASQEEIDQMIAEIVRRCSCNALPRPFPETLCCGNCLCRTKITMAKLILMVRELLPLSVLCGNGLHCLASEFVAVMSRKVNASYTSEEVKRAFKVAPPSHWVA